MNDKQSRFVLWAILILTCFSLISAFQIKFDFKLDHLFPVNDPEVNFYENFKYQFNSDIDDEVIFIGIENSNGIFQLNFLNKIDSLTSYLTKLKHITRVYSLTNSNYFFLKDGTFNARPLIHNHESHLYSEDSLLLFSSPEFRELLISKNGKSIAITAFCQLNLNSKETDILLHSIKNKLQDFGFEKSHFISKSRIERSYIHEMLSNLKIYIVLSILLVAISLYLLYRSLRSIVIPMGIIAISIIWVFALMRIWDVSMDAISSLMPPVLATICMSNIIHFSTQFRAKLKTGMTKQLALHHTFKDIGLATFFTSLTTAIGFLTLATTNVLPIRHFGIFAGIGVLLSYIITIAVFFSYYRLSAAPEFSNIHDSDNQWKNILNKIYDFNLKNKKWINIFYLILTFIAIFFATKLQINGRLLDEIPKNHSMVEDYHFMEQQFYGTRSFELELSLKDQKDSFYDLDQLKHVEKIVKFLKDSCNVGYLISPISFIKAANKAFQGGNHIFYKLPDTQQELNTYVQSIMQTQYAEDMSRHILTDGSKLRISGKLPNLNIKDCQKINHKIDQYFKKENTTHHLNYHLTGTALLMDQMVFSIAKNMKAGLLIAFIVVILIGIYLLRSWTMIFISLAPNIIPLIFIAAIMGGFGIYLKSDTAVIFSISFGIAVDNTIHFLSRVRSELNQGLTLDVAVKNTYLTTGKALIITSLVLLAGFLSLLSSSFNGSFYIGLFISASLFFALILNLSLLPILLLTLYKKDQ